MKARRATQADRPAIDSLLRAKPSERFAGIVRAALDSPTNEYLAAVSPISGEISSVAAYGMIVGTLGTGALYGIAPVSRNVIELLWLAERELKQLGAQRIVAEFPDTEEYKPYRDALLACAYDPVGLVSDFHRDGIGLVILVRVLE